MRERGFRSKGSRKGWAQVPLMAVLLSLSFGLMLSSAVRKSPTVDEQSHLFRGAAYLKTGSAHFYLGHPLLGSIITALPLLTERDLRLPTDDPAWAVGDWSVVANAFLWKLNDNPDRLILLGRLPVMWLTLLLGSLLYRWGRELASVWTGFVAATILVLDPNVIAHARLITTDLSLTVFYVLSIYGFWRWSVGRVRRTTNLLMCGIGLGLAAAAKFNAALLLPTLGILGGILAIRRRSWAPLVGLLFAGIIGWLVIWALYGFTLRPFPATDFWNDLSWALRYFDKPHEAYLAGNYSPDGWWYYFPIVFLLKTPIPTLLFLLYAVFLVTRRKIEQRGFWLAFAFLSLPPLLYFVVSLTFSLNIGYRHLIPTLPFLYLSASALFTVSMRQRPAVRLVITAGVTGWLLVIHLYTWPDYISYFNLLAGGNGWKILSDSNVDWGQDLPALARWQREQQEPIKLSYFGTAPPSHYSKAFEPLPAWVPAPEQLPVARQPFNPADPAPGIYAISVTNLHGVVLGEGRDLYAEFREKEPVARIGGSIFVYAVSASGPGVDVAFSGLRPAELEPGLVERLGTNDLRVRWFDAETSFIWPKEGGWMAAASGQNIGQDLEPYWPVKPEVETDNQYLYKLLPPAPLPWATSEVALSDVVTFLGAKVIEREGHQAAYLTAWRAGRPTDRPLRIFVHLLSSEGEIVAQSDVLDIDPATWRQGDQFVQFHSLQFADSGKTGQITRYDVSVGMYDVETGLRLSAPVTLED